MNSLRNSLPLLFTLISAAIFLPNCGVIHLNGSGSNDSPPAGSLVASGSFFSENGQDVSGGAAIYNNNGSYALFIDGLVAPNTSGLVFIVTVSGTTLSQIGLSSTSGSQTYSLSVGVSNPTFQTVVLHSTTNNEDYGEATLN